MRRFLVFFTAVIFSRFLIRIHFFIKTGNKRMVILYLLGIIISGGILISFFTSGNYSSENSSVDSTSYVVVSKKKFSSSSVKDYYKLIWTELNNGNDINANDLDAVLVYFKEVENFKKNIQEIFNQLPSAERIEIFAALFDELNKHQLFTVSSFYLEEKLKENSWGQDIIYLTPNGLPINISEKELDIKNYGMKRGMLSCRLYPPYTNFIVHKLAALGNIAYSYSDLKANYYHKFEKIIMAAENKVANKYQSFYKNFDNKSEKEQFYFCSGLSVATLDITNPPVLALHRILGRDANYAELMRIYKNPEFVQMTMRQDEENLKRLDRQVRQTMESRIAQYFGWGITQYGSISDTDFDIVDEGRLAAYFDADIRQDKKQIEKCKNIFNKIPAQSEKVLENKGFPYVDRFLEKYCQKLLKSELGLRYYFTKPQSLQQASSQTTYGLTLNISKPVYEKGENISLLFQWYEDNADCKVLEEKVKETLKENQLEIIENGLTCSKDAKATTIKLSVQVKASNVGQYSIPPIELEDVLSNGINFTIKDTNTLKNSLMSKNIKGIKDSLLASSDLNEIKIDGEHPVAHFIKDDMTFAQELIKLGASADVIDKNGYTPLMYAVIRQDNDFLDLLLKKKVYLNEVDKKGRTAIMYAAIKNNLYAAKKLIEHKADIYKSKDDKWTAYKYAKEMKHTEIAELLKSNKDQIVLLIDNCDACRAKEKIFHKLAKNYPSFPRSSVITTTPDNDKNSKEHNWNIKFPFVKIGDSKTLDGDVMSAFHPGHRLDNWDGTEKQLETIMYKD